MWRWMAAKVARLPELERVFVFGSELWQVASADSDIDVALMPRADSISMRSRRAVLTELIRILTTAHSEEYCLDSEHLSLLQASYPIVRVLHRHSRLSMDISVADRWCVPTNQLILDRLRAAQSSGVSVHSLLMCVKLWSKRRSINDAYRRYLNSFAYTLMLLAYLEWQRMRSKEETLGLAPLLRGFFCILRRNI